MVRLFKAVSESVKRVRERRAAKKAARQKAVVDEFGKRLELLKKHMEPPICTQLNWFDITNVEELIPLIKRAGLKDEAERAKHFAKLRVWNLGCMWKSLKGPVEKIAMNSKITAAQIKLLA